MVKTGAEVRTETIESSPGREEAAGTAEEQELLERLAQAVVKFHMTVPAILFLEMSKPLSFVGNQLLVFFKPMAGVVFNDHEYNKAIKLLEDRENIERLIRRIEKLEEEKKDG